jgi:hypothetical protein
MLNCYWKHIYFFLPNRQQSFMLFLLYNIVYVIDLFENPNSCEISTFTLGREIAYGFGGPSEKNVSPH